ncbi:hypothetical protein VNO77_33707 [Canavalia gladiata]|uniref:Uncharacterized protein n=1 Tax=Canavalia gladiata TaxID=3824 RepID=A0AAN9KEM1_CANGL
MLDFFFHKVSSKPYKRLDQLKAQQAQTPTTTPSGPFVGPTAQPRPIDGGGPSASIGPGVGHSRAVTQPRLAKVSLTSP